MRFLFSLVGMALGVVLVSGVFVPQRADAVSPHHDLVIKLEDRCDPDSFNAALGDGACVEGGGRVTFERFITALEQRPERILRTGNVLGWRFMPERASIGPADVILATNTGGEFHTFSAVEEFGGGCIPELNEPFGLNPVPECTDPGVFGATGVTPGNFREFGPFDVGTHYFQCLIHPWQRVTVEVQ